MTLLLRLLLLGLALGAAVITGCATPTTHTLRDIEQTALVPAPAGPDGAGPIGRAGSIALEGGVSASAPSASERDRDTRGTAHVTADLVGRARISGVPVEGVEVGIGAGFARGGLHESHLASDLDASRVEQRTAFGLSLQARGIVLGDDQLGLGLIGELELQLLPYHRAIHTEVYDLTGEKPQLMRSSDSTDEAHAAFLNPRFGVYAATRPSPTTHISFGALAQAYPFFPGAQRADERCFDGRIFYGPCDGAASASDVDPYVYTFLPTLFATFAVELGPVTAITQLYSHAVFTEELEGLTRFGGDLRLRVSF